jgi:CO/xanthine dehydrogenase Mo-binding subunit
MSRRAWNENGLSQTYQLLIDRRTFLTASGALVVSLAVPGDWAEGQTVPSATRPAIRGDQLDSYIAIERDGTVVAYFGKIDGGQGLETAIAQMVAEEIEVPWERVRVVMGSTTVIDMGGSIAARGVSQGGMLLRRTAAEARRLLVGMASTALALPADQLVVTDGVVHAASDPTRRISYAELIGGRYFDTKVKWNGRAGYGLEVTTPAPIKPPDQFKIIGKSLPRRDIPPKVFGTLQMVNDVRLPGMLHARMIRPAVAGAVPVKVDEGSIANIPSAKVVWIKDLLAVVAEKEWNAVKAARALKVTWSDSKPNFPGHERLYDHIRQAPVVKREIQRENGNVNEGFKQAVRIIEGEYEFPNQSHASTGPACSVANVRSDAAEIWTSAQGPYSHAACVAEILGLPAERVTAHWVWGTGSYGSNEQGDADADAAVLSKHLGRPVRVQYMRHEGLAWDAKAPAAINRGKVGLDAKGNVIAYEFISKGFSMHDVVPGHEFASDVLAGHLLGVELKPGLRFNIPVASYSFDHARLGWEVIPPLLERASPLRTTYVRDPFGPGILFGSESFWDEVAAATSTDPVQFRVRYMTNPRDREPVRVAAEHYGWDTRPSPRTDQKASDAPVGRGIAFRRHFDTFIALIAEVRVHRRTGKLDLLRYVCAHDCGMIVNPETLKHVIDRQLVYGTSRAMFEEVRFNESMVTSVDWVTYPVLHVQDVPAKIEVVLIDRPEAEPSGAAEMALGLVPAAIGNAVFDATGVRLRRVPFTPERVKAALDRA